MSAAPSLTLTARLQTELEAVRLIDTHEHLQRDRELPSGARLNLGRFFAHYANCDLVSAGLPAADMQRVADPDSPLSDGDRWRLIRPWYEKAWNTGYCEALRIAWRDLYGIDDLRDDTLEPLADAMRRQVKPGWTRAVFDRAGIEFALEQSLAGPALVFQTDLDAACFLPDMMDAFTGLDMPTLEKESGRAVRCLDDYLDLIDWYFERYAAQAGAFKVGRAYDRPLLWEDVTRADAERVFNRLQAFNDRPDRRAIRALEDFILHTLVRQCGEHKLTMKFHTGIQEGHGNMLTHSRAALLNNLFLKYPGTRFDIYHISYPYQEELTVLAKNCPNVCVDFCWMWIVNPAAGRRALADMLDTVPANKIHGFGGDFIFVEGSYGHAVMARREIARVLAQKVEEGRFTEEYAVRTGRRLLRDNALENFRLTERGLHR